MHFLEYRYKIPPCFRRIVDRIKRLSYEVLVDHKAKFGLDFADNKKALNEVSIVRSKTLKNKIAGYITKFIKKEVREAKEKQSRIDASKSEQQFEKRSETDTVEAETETVEAETDTVEAETETVEAETETVEAEIK
jgi:small subunit ribosomal protein S17e